MLLLACKVQVLPYSLTSAANSTKPSVFVSSTQRKSVISLDDMNKVSEMRWRSDQNHKYEGFFFFFGLFSICKTGSILHIPKRSDPGLPLL